MKKIHEYLEHAAECREMARTASPAHRTQLEQMALTWEQLAASRKRHLEKARSAGGGIRRRKLPTERAFFLYPKKDRNIVLTASRCSGSVPARSTFAPENS